MTTFLLLALLALVFAFLVGFSGASLILGLVVAFAILSILPQLPSPGSFSVPNLNTGKRLLLYGRNLLIFLFDFLRDLTLSNIQLAMDVWTPKDYFNPRLIEVPVGDLTPFQVAFLATRITLTPGTLSIDVSDDQSTMIVHSMYPGEDTAALLRHPIDILKRGL